MRKWIYSNTNGDTEWDDVQSYHGIDKVIESGERKLSFCAMSEMTIMNTWFQKKYIHKYIWQRPGSKQRHVLY